MIYDHQFYGNRQSHRALLRLWLQGQRVLQSLLENNDLHDTFQGPVWILSIPSRHRIETHDTPSLRPLERLISSVCSHWNQTKTPIHYLGPSGLVWQRDTWPQHRLTQRKERLNNMHQALEVNEALWQQYQTTDGAPSAIVVLDDLVTTGATAQAALNGIETWCHAQGLSHIPQKMLALAYVPLE